MIHRKRHRHQIVAALLLAATLALPSGMGQVSANGATRAVVQNARVGPYELRVGILPGRPKVGNLHLSIQIKDAQSGANISDATITLMAAGPEGSTRVGPLLAVNTPANPWYYDSNIPLDMVGSWTLTLEADSNLGKSSLELPLEVTGPEGIDILFVIAGAVGIALLAMWIWNRTGGRRTHTGKQA